MFFRRLRWRSELGVLINPLACQKMAVAFHRATSALLLSLGRFNTRSSEGPVMETYVFKSMVSLIPLFLVISHLVIPLAPSLSLGLSLYFPLTFTFFSAHNFRLYQEMLYLLNKNFFCLFQQFFFLRHFFYFSIPVYDFALIVSVS